MVFDLGGLGSVGDICEVPVGPGVLDDAPAGLPFDLDAPMGEAMGGEAHRFKHVVNYIWSVTVFIQLRATMFVFLLNNLCYVSVYLFYMTAILMHIYTFLNIFIIEQQ